MSRSRRYNIAQNLNRSVKDTLQNDTPGEYLFGADLGERIKTAKAVQKSSQDLQPASTYFGSATVSQVP